MADVFISYHTKSASFIVRQIADTLERHGISCWYAPRNVEGAFARAITNAIDQCRVFLLILNEQANQSEHVLNEVNYAFARFQSKKMRYIPFRINGASMSKELRYYLGRIQIVEAKWQNNTLQLQELTTLVSKILGYRTPVPKIKTPLYDKVYISERSAAQELALRARQELSIQLRLRSSSLIDTVKEELRQGIYQTDSLEIARKILLLGDERQE